MKNDVACLVRPGGIPLSANGLQFMQENSRRALAGLVGEIDESFADTYHYVRHIVGPVTVCMIKPRAIPLSLFTRSR